MVQNQIFETAKPSTYLYRQNVKPMKSVKVSYFLFFILTYYFLLQVNNKINF